MERSNEGSQASSSGSRLQVKRPVAADAVACFVALALGAAYIGHFAWRQWLPWDDGTMAQAAERVLKGQLPHRDFNEAYTGGLTWLHAAAFRLLGASIWSLRTTLVAFAVASIPVWYYIARRFASPVVAGVATLTCVAWSVPNYPAPLPSWYNLFFAMAGLAALLRFIEQRTLRWLFVAGLAIGFSILAKITGLYLAAGIVVFLTFDASFDETHVASPHPSSIAAGLLLVGLVFAVAPLFLSVSAHDSNSFNSLVSLGLPPAAMAGAASLVIIRRRNLGWHPSAHAIKALLVLSSGAASVLLAFSIPYFAAHATDALLQGVLLRAQFRLQVRSVSAPGPGLMWLGFALPLAYACVRGPRDDLARGAWIAALIVFWIVADAAAFSRLPGLFLWLSVRMLMLPLVGLVAWQMWRVSSAGGVSTTRMRQLVLAASTAAWCSLVQFPFTYPTYFAYVAPLVIITTLALAETNRRLAPIFRIITLAGYLVFAVIMRPRIYPERAVDAGPMAELTPPRGGILVSGGDALSYHQLVSLLNAHSRGRFTLATPDLPEVYFLSNLNNPTRSFFESLDYPPTNPSDILKQIDEHGITAIVINHQPQFSAPVSTDLQDSLVHRFPQTESIGALEVRWHQ